MRDRPDSETEIEVTPEMIEAGESVLYAWSPGFDGLEADAAERVFRAMLRARPKMANRLGCGICPDGLPDGEAS